VIDQQVSVAAEREQAARAEVAPAPAAVVYGDVPNRLVALAIDAVLLSLVVLAGAVLVSLTVGPVVRIDGSSVRVDRDIAIVDAFLSTLLGGLYFAGSWARVGATPGQRLLGLRVVQAGDGDRVMVRHAVVRWLLLAAPLGIASLLTTAVVSGAAEALVDLALIGWYLALLVTSARDPRARGLHDRWAGTAVTKPARPVDWAPWRAEPAG
jgi:uncharacterized RDD family membrane protein YckC